MPARPKICGVRFPENSNKKDADFLFPTRNRVFFCSSAPSATKYSRKNPVWQIRPPFPGVILPHLGCSCFYFVTFDLHNLCSFCAFGQKGGFHNPFFAFFTQNNMKSPRKPCYFQFSRFTGRYDRKKPVFPVPSPFFRLLPAPGRAAGRKKSAGGKPSSGSISP